mmetsp:Transcript_27093/g.68167  ORF Transcript_27093/g.68167 Transcript_27093/m.68167 type:complete len:574 (+) Transcript_27093:238-1959(+)
MADVPRRVPRVLLSHFSVSLPRLLLLLSVVSLHAVNSFAAVEEQSSDHEEQLDRTGPAARVRSHVHIGRSCRRFKTETTPELSEFGKNVKTIVLAGLGGGPVCEASTGDWRANLPRFLGAYTGAEVIIYDPRQRSCRTCYSAQKRARKIPCEHRMTNGVDLLLLIGSGKIGGSKGNCAPNASWCPRQFLDLSAIMQRRWAGRANRTVHFPIRNMDRLMNNRAFDFDVIIDDGSFAKPINDCAVEALQRCMNEPKENTLVYVARLVDHKGQLSFVRKADPEPLQGYTIEMYGKKMRPKYIQDVKDVAREKGIRVRVEGKVGKTHLFQRICSAKGLVIHSVDKNPRSVYEGVVAGLPAFVSKEAQISPTLTSMPFVVETGRAKSTREFNDDLRRYMQVLQRNWTDSIIAWRREEMTSEAVYKGLCQRMGVCAPGKFDFEPWDFGEYVKPKVRMTSAQMRKQKVYVRANGTGVHEGGDSAQGHSRLSMRIQVSNAVEEVDDAPEGDEADYGGLGDLAEAPRTGVKERSSRGLTRTGARGWRSGLRGARAGARQGSGDGTADHEQLDLDVGILEDYT